MAEKEYIAKEFVINTINELKTQPVPKTIFLEHLQQIIEDIPAADVVPVVHCKNCEYNNECSVQDFGEMHQNDFCSRGKRRADNG